MSRMLRFRTSAQCTKGAALMTKKSINAFAYDELQCSRNNFLEKDLLHYTSGRNTFKFGLETTLSIQESSKINLVQSLSNQ